MKIKIDYVKKFDSSRKYSMKLHRNQIVRVMAMFEATGSVKRVTHKGRRKNVTADAFSTHGRKSQ